MTSALQYAVWGSVAGLPFVPAPRMYRGCMGRQVPGVEFVPGAYRENPTLVFSWLVHRYAPTSQVAALETFTAAGDQDFLLSWPDFNGSPDDFARGILELRRRWQFRPLVMLSSKAFPTDFASVVTLVDPVIPALRQAGVPRVCIGWELNSWLSPEVLQQIIDRYAPIVRGWGAFLYVHFTEGYAAWQPNGLLFSDFWRANVNKLRGVLHQKIQSQTIAQYQTGEGGLRDILLHFNGGNFCPADSGDGTPFDLIAFEVDLQLLALGRISEAEMHRRAHGGISTQPTSGPTGPVHVMGSGSG